VRQLLQHSAYIDIQDSAGDTALVKVLLSSTYLFARIQVSDVWASFENNVQFSLLIPCSSYIMTE